MWAGALVSAVAVVAGAAVQAGSGVALVDVVLAVAPREARRTQTREGVDAVHTGATVEAGAAGKQSKTMLKIERSHLRILRKKKRANQYNSH